MTYGRMTALAIPKSARNIPGAAVVAQALAGAPAAAALSTLTGMPSARRDVRLNTAGSAVNEVFAQSALISRGWIDPGQSKTDAVFKAMIESVVSGASLPATAVSEASQEFSQIIPTVY